MDDPDVSLIYRKHRPYLVDLAFRMLGDMARPRMSSRTRSLA